jgi:hypothetical protein
VQYKNKKIKQSKTMEKKRLRIKGVLVSPEEYAKIGRNIERRPRIYVRSSRPNRMKAVMVAATFATFAAFFENGGYDSQGAKWCSEVWQISRFYQDYTPVRA